MRRPLYVTDYPIIEYKGGKLRTKTPGVGGDSGFHVVKGEQ